MKYPKNQFLKLEAYIKEVNKYVPVKNMHPNQLNSIIYANVNEHLRHNSILVNKKDNTKLAKQYNFNKEICEELDKPYYPNQNDFKNILEIDNSFVLYPIGCNDNHVYTAVKKIQKSL